MEVAPRREMVAFLDSLGTADVDHTGGDFLQHLCGVHDLLLARGASARVAAAGMFHSIYGTETFQGFSLPLDQRPRVQELIGERAEHLAWCNCVMDRASFDASLGDALAGAEQLEIRDRHGSPIVAQPRGAARARRSPTVRLARAGRARRQRRSLRRLDRSAVRAGATADAPTDRWPSWLGGVDSGSTAPSSPASRSLRRTKTLP